LAVPYPTLSNEQNQPKRYECILVSL